MNKLRYILLFAVMNLFMFSSCRREEPNPNPDALHTNSANGAAGYVAFSFNLSTLRSADYYQDSKGIISDAPNKDTEDKEDHVEQIRVIIFDHAAGDDAKPIFNELYTLSSGTRKSVIKLSSNEVKPSMDFYFIANEDGLKPFSSSDLTKGETAVYNAEFLKALTSPTLTRSGLEQLKMLSPVYPVTGFGAVVGINRETKLIPMTAVYKGVTINLSQLTGSSEDNPYQLDFSTFNTAQHGSSVQQTDRKAVELLRVLAKVEIIIKDVVIAERNASGKLQYSWVFPYGSDVSNDFQFEIKDIPRYFSLFPIQNRVDYNNRQDLLTSSTYYKLNTNDFVFKDSYSTPKGIKLDARPYVFNKPEADSELPIGGMVTCDFRLCYYVPEYLIGTKETNALPLGTKPPALEINYKRTNETSYTSQSFPFQNRKATESDNSIVIGYKDIFGNNLPQKDYNIYRNKWYKITLWINGRDLEGNTVKPVKPDTTDKTTRRVQATNNTSPNLFHLESFKVM